ncbi:unnamed protein product [Rotaria sp. Silwood1]|nr:unnamed protein product [Rotaria sp. Silwood1]CAF1631308.1 unnamed protein product [Rotaria sp. Silwood1]
MNTSSEAQAYGAGRAGSAFDPIGFIKKPQVILRIVAWVFSIIVFGCIAQEGYADDTCRYNGSNACGYGVGIGVISFILTLAFTGIDLYFPNISNVKTRKTIVLSELVLSGILVFLWFIGFCYMTDQWRKEDNKDKEGWNGRNSVQSAIAFAFFSILIWAALTFFAFRRYREGVLNLFSSNYEDHSTVPGQTYGGYTSGVGAGSFSQPPFTATQQVQSNYQPTTY